MRILHTADWHLGKLLKGVDRTPEIAAALDDLGQMVAKERIELVLVCGDLFDKAQVSTEAQAAAFGFFKRLSELKVPSLVIAGNHDSREGLEALSPLLSLAGATVRGQVRLAGKGGEVEVAGVKAAMLPFLSERRLVSAQGLLEGDSTRWKGSYDEGIRRVISNLTESFEPRQINLILGHLTVDGSKLGGGEFTFYTTNSYAVSPSTFPVTSSYVALGHIHRQQQVSAAPAAWYSGSLVQLDFGEGEEAPRGVIIAEVSAGVAPVVTPVDVRWGKPLKTFRIKLDELDRKLESVREFSGYAKLVLEGRGNPALRERIFRQLPQVLDVEFRTQEQETLSGEVFDPEELDWSETYSQYHQETTGAAPQEGLMKAFRQAYEETLVEPV